MKGLKQLLLVAVFVAAVFFAGSYGPTWLAGFQTDAGAMPADASGPCQLRNVVDGDTADLRCEGEDVRVRLLKIDTPERDEPGYAEATRALGEQLAGRELFLVFENPGEPMRDRYARVLAYLFAGGRNVNVEMVRGGFSDFDTRFGEGRFEGAFRQAVRREAASGL